MANNHPEQDPAEGSRETINKQLKQEGVEKQAPDARGKLKEEVKQQTDLPQRGSA